MFPEIACQTLLFSVDLFVDWFAIQQTGDALATFTKNLQMYSRIALCALISLSVIKPPFIIVVKQYFVHSDMLLLSIVHRCR